MDDLTRSPEPEVEVLEPVERLRDELIEALESDDSAEVERLVDEAHPADLADVVEQLEPEHVRELVEQLDVEEAADLFEELEDASLQVVAEQLSDETLADVLEEMSSDQAADLIADLDPERQRDVLELMEDEDSDEVEVLLAFGAETAGGIMQAEVITLDGRTTADDAIQQIRSLQLDAEHPFYVYVLQPDRRLVGVLSIRRLLSMPGPAAIQDYMTTPPITATVDEDQEEVAQRMRKYDLLALPVVDAEGYLRGVVTADDVMDILEEELQEDLYRFAGTIDPRLRRTVLSAAAARLPVILLCLLGEVIAGRAVLRNEHRVEHLAALAAFMPALMATGGNIGQQSLAKFLRRIATGELVSRGLLRALLRETAIGLAMGLVTGLTLGLIAHVTVPGFGYGLVVLIGGALTLTSLIAATLGAAVPLVLDRFQRDPAIASGPLITTLNDIISTTIYFAMAVWLLHWFAPG